MVTSEFRQLSPYEKNLLDRLLGKEVKDRDTLIRQIAGSAVRQIDANGSLEFQVNVPEKANVNFRIPTEGVAEDVDHIKIHVLLHIVDGAISELEIYKEDLSSVIQMPDVNNIDLFHPDN